MVAGYIILITNGIATIDRVPQHLKVNVLDGLRKLGLDGYGNPLED